MTTVKIPNKETKICISVSKKPGNTGSLLHNTSYKILKLNYLYIPLKAEKIEDVFGLIKSLNVEGCSLSMPFKEKAIGYVAKVDKNAKENAA